LDKENSEEKIAEVEADLSNDESALNNLEGSVEGLDSAALAQKNIALLVNSVPLSQTILSGLLRTSSS
jgi:hypothetical protein